MYDFTAKEDTDLTLKQVHTHTHTHTHTDMLVMLLVLGNITYFKTFYKSQFITNIQHQHISRDLLSSLGRKVI